MFIIITETEMNAELTYKTSVTNDPVRPGVQIICNPAQRKRTKTQTTRPVKSNCIHVSTKYLLLETNLCDCDSVAAQMKCAYPLSPGVFKRVSCIFVHAAAAASALQVHWLSAAEVVWQVDGALLLPLGGDLP